MIHNEIPAPVPLARLVYSVEQAAEVLGISRTAAFEAIAAGQLKSYKHGRRRRIAHVDLVAYADSLRLQHGGRT